ncbi:MAG: hypothetical protein AAB861_03365 [Patescibacteria group bacterium]
MSIRWFLLAIFFYLTWSVLELDAEQNKVQFLPTKEKVSAAEHRKYDDFNQAFEKKFVELGKNFSDIWMVERKIFCIPDAGHHNDIIEIKMRAGNASSLIIFFPFGKNAEAAERAAKTLTKSVKEFEKRQKNRPPLSQLPRA